MAEKKVDNVKINVEFSEENELKELKSGDGLSALMGKLAKAVKDFIAHLADGVNIFRLPKGQIGTAKPTEHTDIPRRKSAGCPRLFPPTGEMRTQWTAYTLGSLVR